MTSLSPYAYPRAIADTGCIVIYFLGRVARTLYVDAALSCTHVAPSSRHTDELCEKRLNESICGSDDRFVHVGLCGALH